MMKLAKQEIVRVGEARIKLLRLDSGVDLTTKVKILRIIPQPTAFYGKGLAIRGSEKARLWLRVTKRLVIRRCLEAPWFVPGRMLQESAGVRDIVEVAEEIKMKLMEAIRDHSNKGLRAIADVFVR